MTADGHVRLFRRRFLLLQFFDELQCQTTTIDGTVGASRHGGTNRRPENNDARVVVVVRTMPRCDTAGWDPLVQDGWQYDFGSNNLHQRQLRLILPLLYAFNQPSCHRRIVVTFSFRSGLFQRGWLLGCCRMVAFVVVVLVGWTWMVVVRTATRADE